MKINLILMLAFIVSAAFAQKTKKDTSRNLFEQTKIYANTSSTLLALNNPKNIVPETYEYVKMVGHIGFGGSKHNFLLVVKDTSKLAIRYQDSIFVIHQTNK